MRAMLILPVLGLAACMAAGPGTRPAPARGDGTPGALRLAKGPPILPDPDAIRIEGVWVDARPCGHVRRDDGSRVMIPTRLHGLTPGSRVVVLGERMAPVPECGGPALVIRGWSAAP
jgi:hypothetical protein